MMGERKSQLEAWEKTEKKSSSRRQSDDDLDTAVGRLPKRIKRATTSEKREDLQSKGKGRHT